MRTKFRRIVSVLLVLSVVAAGLLVWTFQRKRHEATTVHFTAFVPPVRMSSKENLSPIPSTLKEIAPLEEQFLRAKNWSEVQSVFNDTPPIDAKIAEAFNQARSKPFNFTISILSATEVEGSSIVAVYLQVAPYDLTTGEPRSWRVEVYSQKNGHWVREVTPRDSLIDYLALHTPNSIQGDESGLRSAATKVFPLQ
jgi:hypothetical protein